MGMKVLKAIGFWLVSLTWGSPMTLYGAAVALALLVSGHRPRLFRYFVCFEVGEHWGGFEAGGFFVVNRGAGDALKQHEAGHGLQNLLFGPLMPFVVSIPSAIRYWVRRAKIRRGEGGALKPYDAIWFERLATQWGARCYGNGGL